MTTTVAGWTLDVQWLGWRYSWVLAVNRRRHGLHPHWLPVVPMRTQLGWCLVAWAFGVCVYRQRT